MKVCENYHWDLEISDNEIYSKNEVVLLKTGSTMKMEFGKLIGLEKRTMKLRG